MVWSHTGRGEEGRRHRSWLLEEVDDWRREEVLGGRSAGCDS